MGQVSKDKIERRTLPLILLIVFLDILGIGILIPVLPQLVYDIFTPAGYSLKEAFIILGGLAAIFPFMQFFAAPILGQLSDRYGRRNVLSSSLFGTALGYGFFAVGILTKNIPLMFFGRALDGITGGNLSVARAVIADISVPENRTRNFGLVGATFGFGFVLGPFLGARLASPNADFFGLFTTPSWFDPATPFWFTAILSLVTTALVLAKLPETHHNINRKLRLTWNKSISNIRAAAVSKKLRVIYATDFLFWSGFTFFTTFFAILLTEKLGFSRANVGDFFAYIGISIVLAQIFIVRPLSRRFTNYQVLRVAVPMTAVALFLHLMPNNTTQLLLVAPLIAIFNGLYIANSTALISVSAAEGRQGEALGIQASVQALAQAIPAFMAGYVATVNVSAPIVVGGGVIVLAAVVFGFLYRPDASVKEAETADVRAAAH